MDGVVVRAEMLAAVRDECRGRSARLATVVVGDNPRCHAFARDKRSAATEAGIATVAVDLAASTTQDELDQAIAALADDPGVTGIFVQLPLPAHLVLGPIPPAKDVDGLGPGGHPPSAAAAVVRLLDHYHIAIDGRRAVIIGGHHTRLAGLLTDRGADVTLLGEDDEPSPDTCRGADILVVAAGRPRSVTADHVRPGAAVLDVTGAVDLRSVAQAAGAVAPYPTGVGPVAVACLLRHTLGAAR